MALHRCLRATLFRNLLLYRSYCQLPERLLNSEIFSKLTPSSSFPHKSVILGKQGQAEVRGTVLVDNPLNFVTQSEPGIQTAWDLFLRGVSVGGDGPCLSTFSSSKNAYEHISYNEVQKEVQYLSSAMVQVGLQPSNSTFVAIQSRNRKEHTMSVLATVLNSMVSVPIYDHLSDQNLEHILRQVEAGLLMCETNTMVSDALKLGLPHLKRIVVYEPLHPDVAREAFKLGVEAWSYQDFLDIGRKNKCDAKLPSADDIFSIVYTSGTTGFPKGVTITHRNFVVNLTGYVAGVGVFGRDGGTYFSYLPPAHAYESMMQMKSLYRGRKVAFFRGNVADLEADLQLTQPTIIPTVPRILNRLYKRAMQDIQASPYKREMLKAALEAKEYMLKDGVVTKNSPWDRLIFSGVQAMLGGCQEVMMVGAAPCSNEVIKFFQRASGSAFFEIYGQTEGNSLAMTLPCETEAGVLGAPSPVVHATLRDVPEMGYYLKDGGIGELCFRGPGITVGYYKRPDLTQKSIVDGWWKTGDIAKWTEDGYLRLVDRKKHIFKLSQGVYVAPEKIESVYSQSQMVTNVFITGHSDKDYVVAVVAPDPSALARLAAGQKSPNVQLKSREIRKIFLESLHQMGKANGLNSLEQARNLALTKDSFFQMGLLTPTHKLRRSEAQKMFENTVEELYGEPPL